MPFKIVQTKDFGRKAPTLTIVPSKWERNGVLFWPPKRLRTGSKLIRDPNSVPGLDWDQCECVKKRDNFILYESAEAEMAAMSYNTDSDVAEVIEKPRKLCPQLNNPRTKIGRTPQVSFNSLAEKCYGLEEQNKNTAIEPEEEPEIGIASKIGTKKDLEISNSSETKNLLPKVTILQAIPIKPACGAQPPVEIQFPYVTPTSLLFRSNSEEIKEQEENISGPSEIPNNLRGSQIIYEFTETGNGNTVVDTNDNIELHEEPNNNSSIRENQRILVSNQNKIINELAKVKTMLGVLLENQRKDGSANILKEIPSKQKETVSESLPINSFDKLEELELTLSNKRLQQKLVDEKSLVCGTSGKRNGQTCCYSLVDHFFDRNFLMTCSWAGGSRDKDRKIAFKSFNQIINTFFQIINLADAQFSMTDCENFFKCVIKNAKRRASSLETPHRKRSSAFKSRPSNLKYKKIQENIENVMETDTGVSDDETHHDDPKLPDDLKLTDEDSN